jgi:hypothetical protein
LGLFVAIAILPLERLLCLPVQLVPFRSVTNNNNNNFRILRKASILGWVNTDAGSGTKNKNNTFSKWTGLNSPTGAFTVLSITGTTTVSDTITH